MKKFLSLEPIAVLSISCSSDDNDDESVAGIYTLTEFSVSNPQDLNGDGVASTDMLSETVCLDDAFLQLYADNTFTASGEGIDISLDSEGNPQISCMDDGNYSGTYEVSGNTVTMSYTSDGEVYTDQFEINNNSISYTVEDGAAVGVDNNGNPVFITTDITIVYTKQ
ncbi:MAG TPA: lipocalin family protein [Flavobacterium sp.]|jgi:hypothetical protein